MSSEGSPRRTFHGVLLDLALSKTDVYVSTTDGDVYSGKLYHTGTDYVEIYTGTARDHEVGNYNIPISAITSVRTVTFTEESQNDK